jgi:putative transposase
MKAVATERRRFGYPRIKSEDLIHMMLQRQGIVMNLKKLRRLHSEEKRQVRKRGGRKRALGTRRPMLVPDRPNQRWSLDFVSDSFTDGRRFRVLTVVDDHTRECLAPVADTSLSGLRVVRELDTVIARRACLGSRSEGCDGRQYRPRGFSTCKPPPKPPPPGEAPVATVCLIRHHRDLS